MALQLAILVLLLVFVLALFVLALVSGNKFFFIGSFLVLMFSGVLIQSSGGLIIDTLPTGFSSGAVSYTDTVVTLEDSGLYLFSQACFWIGLVMVAWTGLVSAFGSRPVASPFSF